MSAAEAYQKERKRLAEERRRSRHKLEAASAEIERKIARLLTLVENGHADPVAAGPRINELVAERKRLAEALKQQPASNVVECFPKAAERYRQKVEDIHAALSRGEEGDHEAVALVRSLIGRIVVHATPAPEPPGLEVEGSLAADDRSTAAGIFRHKLLQAPATTFAGFVGDPVLDARRWALGGDLTPSTRSAAASCTQ